MLKTGADDDAVDEAAWEGGKFDFVVLNVTEGKKLRKLPPQPKAGAGQIL
jgi:hypothetical protein